jgi:hypothetical protein
MDWVPNHALGARAWAGTSSVTLTCSIDLHGSMSEWVPSLFHVSRTDPFSSLTTQGKMQDTRGWSLWRSYVDAATFRDFPSSGSLRHFYGLARKVVGCVVLLLWRWRLGSCDISCADGDEEEIFCGLRVFWHFRCGTGRGGDFEN